VSPVQLATQSNTRTDILIQIRSWKYFPKHWAPICYCSKLAVGYTNLWYIQPIQTFDDNDDLQLIPHKLKSTTKANQSTIPTPKLFCYRY